MHLPDNVYLQLPDIALRNTVRTYPVKDVILLQILRIAQIIHMRGQIPILLQPALGVSYLCSCQKQGSTTPVSDFTKLCRLGIQSR